MAWHIVGAQQICRESMIEWRQWGWNARMRGETRKPRTKGIRLFRALERLEVRVLTDSGNVLREWRSGRLTLFLTNSENPEGNVSKPGRWFTVHLPNMSYKTSFSLRADPKTANFYSSYSWCLGPWGSNTHGQQPGHLSLSLASLIAQSVKNLPAMQETPVWFLGQEDPLE